MNTTTHIALRPRWWQLIRRWKAWRARKELIGTQIMYDGELRTIVDYREDLVTVDRREGTR